MMLVAVLADLVLRHRLRGNYPTLSLTNPISTIKLTNSLTAECTSHDGLFQAFKNTKWSGKSEKVDTILTEPPHAPSRSFHLYVRTTIWKGDQIENEVSEKFPSFWMLVLQPGGYVIPVTPLYLFAEWYEAFVSSGFSVIDHLYLFTKDSKTVPSMILQRYALCGNIFAMAAYLPAPTSSKFFSSDFLVTR